MPCFARNQTPRAYAAMAKGWISPARYCARAFERLNLPELVRGRVRGGISSIRQFMPVIVRKRSRIVSRGAMRSATSLVRPRPQTAGVYSAPGRVVAKDGVSPDLEVQGAGSAEEKRVSTGNE